MRWLRHCPYVITTVKNTCVLLHTLSKYQQVDSASAMSEMPQTQILVHRPRAQQQGVQGTEYICVCKPCGIVYDIEGYQTVGSYTGMAANRVKLSHPPEYTDTSWLRVSAETFVHCDIVRQFHASFQSMQANLFAWTQHNKFVILQTSGMWMPPGFYERQSRPCNKMDLVHIIPPAVAGAAVGPRVFLDERRLEEAVFRSQVLGVVRQLPLALRCNINLAGPIDQLQDQVPEVLDTTAFLQ
jgi:hypothetical protein